MTVTNLYGPRVRVTLRCDGCQYLRLGPEFPACAHPDADGVAINSYSLDTPRTCPLYELGVRVAKCGVEDLERLAGV